MASNSAGNATREWIDPYNNRWVRLYSTSKREWHAIRLQDNSPLWHLKRERYGNDAVIKLHDGDHRGDFLIDGHFGSSAFQIYDIRGGGRQIAGEIIHSNIINNPIPGLVSSFTKTDNYLLKVMPGYDYVFVASIGVIIDELWYDAN